jgi:hypothetical protein
MRNRVGIPDARFLIVPTLSGSGYEKASNHDCKTATCELDSGNCIAEIPRYPLQDVSFLVKPAEMRVSPLELPRVSGNLIVAPQSYGKGI